MESEDAYCDIPQCPQLRPSISSEEFDEINLEENFYISEIETETQETYFQQDFTEQENEPISKGKRSFHQVGTTNKPSFQYYIQRPQKRQLYVNESDPQKKFTVEVKG